ncbi:MAG: DJ-1/PfpI family protein [Spirochaetaceae bacterium]|jgi:4-methyl-5(b-hydroxyethyl)-thiazole monophosphate biosynthesis|nr:DJ-1/PfpI family protein [Spirochaetaceae bacterium]
MKRIVIFLAEGFEEIEAVTPADYCRRADFEVIIASCGASLDVRGSHGIIVRADTTAVQLARRSVPWDAVVSPGGMPGAANIAACADACAVIRWVWDAGGIVAALCAAPAVVLSGLGILAGKRWTCYPGMEAELGKWAGTDWREVTAGSIHTGVSHVVDGRLITGQAPGAAEEFALALVEALAGPGKAQQLRAVSCVRPERGC